MKKEEKTFIVRRINNGQKGIGTFRVGYLPKGTTYQDLVAVFGEPQFSKDYFTDGKVQVEWLGSIDGHTFTIYDYKDPLPAEEVIDWHIGAFVKETAALVISYFNSCIKYDIG